MNETIHTDRERESSQHFVERLAEHYRPEPLGPLERARFDARLRERIERRRRAPAWVPSLAGVAAVLALIWWVWPAATAPSPAAVDRAASDASWEADVLLVDADAELAEEEYLPDEYVAIAFAFIDGT
jgi:hypothetical protein